MFKRNSMRFAAVLLAALAGLVAGPNAALDAAPQHRDQVPGFYRLKVGDLEVTALYDGTGVFDPHWLNGTKATMDGVVKGLQEDPHLLQRGVPLEEVSKLLGHSSTKVTEKHYAPWIKGRQDRLDSFMLPIVSGKKSAA